MTMRKHAAAILIAMVLGAILVPAFAYAETYTIVMPGTVSISGKSRNQMDTFIEEVAKALSSATGEQFKVDSTSLAEEDFMKYALSNMINKKYAAAGFSGEWYAKLPPAMREKFPPLFGITINGKKDENYCFYVRKGDGIKSVDQLRGKTLSTYVYTDARYTLYKNGIDEPLNKFFGKVKYDLTVAPVLMQQLVEKDIDAFLTADFQVDTSRGVDPRFKDIVPIGCKEYVVTPFLIYRNDIDPAIVSKLQTAIKAWKKDPLFKSIKIFMVAIKGDVAIFTMKDFEKTFAIQKMAFDRGWEDEKKDFMKKAGK